MSNRADVCVVTDSVADIPRELVEEYGITVVPLSFAIDGQTFIDGELPMAEFFEKLKAVKDLPKTSQPSAGEFARVFEERLEQFGHVICVNISHRLSGTIESARQAARAFGDRVQVHDSLNLSWGEGFQVVAAAKAAAAGASLGEVVDAFEQAHKRIHMVVGLDTLEYLARGGRIGRVSAFLGGVLNMKVLLTVAGDGAFEPVYRGRGVKAALQASVDWLGEYVDSKKRAAFGVLHAESPDKAEWLEDAIRARFNVAELQVIETGPVIGAHTGTGWGLTCAQVD